jgi:peptidoglycan/xylan/chitin deacetylase (PgdA/CDA1 family)
MSNFVISLDFEMFWGVADSQTLDGYKDNVYGVWDVVPKLLSLFEKYEVKATWATVGMVMCQDYTQWLDIRSVHEKLPKPPSNYDLGPIVKEYPRLFFAKSLVQQILDAKEQELATHTFSHFLCNEEVSNKSLFTSDILCAQEVASSFGVQLESIVFPRNQYDYAHISELPKLGIKAFRGNQNHWIYRGGHYVPYGLVGRAFRLADSWVPISGSHIHHIESIHQVANVPASLFLRPWSPKLAKFDNIRLKRISSMMNQAVVADGIFHLWWHPHNFGVNTDGNLNFLEKILIHFSKLRDENGMKSSPMKDFKCIL